MQWLTYLWSKTKWIFSIPCKCNYFWSSSVQDKKKFFYSPDQWLYIRYLRSNTPAMCTHWQEVSQEDSDLKCLGGSKKGAAGNWPANYIFSQQVLGDVWLANLSISGCHSTHGKQLGLKKKINQKDSPVCFFHLLTLLPGGNHCFNTFLHILPEFLNH